MKKLDKFKPLIHSDCQIVDSNFGSFVEIGERSIISNSNFGDYSYCTRFCDIANTDIKKFSNIASSVRIGPTDHPMEKTSARCPICARRAPFEDSASSFVSGWMQISPHEAPLA